MWFNSAERGFAVHICRRHCRVIKECSKALQHTEISYGVMGGVAFGDHGIPLTRNGTGKTAAVCGPYCRVYRKSDIDGERE